MSSSLGFAAALAAAFFLLPGVGHGERMKTCNAQAASQGIKGEKRKQFMSRCLRG